MEADSSKEVRGVTCAVKRAVEWDPDL